MVYWDVVWHVRCLGYIKVCLIVDDVMVWGVVREPVAIIT